jgi:hypothetical protein
MVPWYSSTLPPRYTYYGHTMVEYSYHGTYVYVPWYQMVRTTVVHVPWYVHVYVPWYVHVYVHVRTLPDGTFGTNGRPIWYHGISPLRVFVVHVYQWYQLHRPGFLVVSEMMLLAHGIVHVDHRIWGIYSHDWYTCAYHGGTRAQSRQPAKVGGYVRGRTRVCGRSVPHENHPRECVRAYHMALIGHRVFAPAGRAQQQGRSLTERDTPREGREDGGVTQSGVKHR